MFVFKRSSKSASPARYFNCAITSVKDHYLIILQGHVSKRYSPPTIRRLLDTNASKMELLIDKAPSFYQKVSSISSPRGLFVLLTMFSFRNNAFWQLLLYSYWGLGNWPDLRTTPSRCTLLDPLPVVCLNAICSWQELPSNT